MQLLKLFGRNKQQVTNGDPILDEPLCWFSEYDPFTVRNACEGVSIFGGVGSGKSSGSGRTLALEYLSSGMGGLVLCAKIEEREVWQKYAHMTGRTDDLIIISKESGIRFNPLDYMLSRKGGASSTENIVRTVCDSLDISGSNNDGGEDGGYFTKTKEQLIRNGVDLFRLAGEKLSITGLFRLVRSAPKLADLESIDWQKGSYCYQLVLEARKNIRALKEEGGTSAKNNVTSHASMDDFIECVKYWLDEFPSIPDKTRLNIISTFTSSVEPLTRGALNTLFSGETDVTPEEAFSGKGTSAKPINGKIIIVDYPVKEWLNAGIFIQATIKKLFQQAAEMRPVSNDTTPSFLWVDEAQNFIESYDMDFFATSRGARICPVYMSQNISNYYSKIDNRSVVDSILANLSTKIFHANNDFVTNKWASDHIGQGVRQLYSSNTSLSESPSNDAFDDTFMFNKPSNASVSSSVSETYAYQVEPNEFFKLRKGGYENDLKVDAIIVQSGRIWNFTETNWLVTEFSQS